MSASAAPAGYATRWRGLIFIALSLGLISLDNTILNVALPSISRALGASASDLQWIVDAYVLVFAALLLTMGSIGDRIGRKRALQIGLVLFGVGSLAAALSTSTLMLILTRAFLGIGGALIMPATLSLISATFPPNERAQAIGIWAAVFGLGIGLGPVLGGLLVTYFPWNAVFLVNIPVVIIALVGAALYLGESRDEHAPAPDIPGVVLSIIGLFALVFGIIEAGLKGWTAPDVLVAFAVAAVFLIAFIVWEARAPNAMLPMRFFQNRSFTGANLSLTLTSFAMFGAMFFMSQYFQTVQQVPTFQAGLRVLPMAITLTFMGTRAPKIAARFGAKRTIAIGVLIASGGMFYLSQVIRVDTPYILVAVGQVILALGLGMAFSPATATVMSSVPVSKAGIGSAMNDTTRQLGGALGIAALGTVATNAYLSGLDSLNGLLSSLPEQANAAIRSSIQAAHIVANDPQVPEAARAAILAAADQAFVNGMTSAMLIGSLVMFGAFVLVSLVLPAHTRRLMTTEVEAIPAAGD